MGFHWPAWIWHYLCLAFWGFAAGWDLRQQDWVSVVIDLAFVAFLTILAVRRRRREHDYERRQAHRAKINGGA